MLLGVFLTWRTVQSQHNQSELVPTQHLSAPASTTPGKFLGSASCSARGCHGGIEPRHDGSVEQNEYTRWVLDDPHSRAFDVLNSKRSLKMAKMIGLSSSPAESERCLVCHSSPKSEKAPSPHNLDNERLMGIGCEACHGPSSGWLDAHTERDWNRSTSRETKQQRGMTLLGEPDGFAKACVGCHVGAPATLGMPERNVDHDLIAAGHPRLAFEFDAFMDHMPAHWSKKCAAARVPDFETRGWLVGQTHIVVSSLELLQARNSAVPRSWPEFAEYDCFACHHGLSDKVGAAKANRLGAPPGSLPWCEWPYLIADKLDSPPSLKQSLAKLKAAMEKPFSDQKNVAELTAAALVEAKKWERAVIASKNDPAAWRARMALLTKAPDQDTGMSWDASAQVYYGLAALAGSKPEPKVQSLLDELAKTLAFPVVPAEEAFWDSPRHFDSALFEGKLTLLRQEMAKSKE